MQEQGSVGTLNTLDTLVEIKMSILSLPQAAYLARAANAAAHFKARISVHFHVEGGLIAHAIQDDDRSIHICYDMYGIDDYDRVKALMILSEHYTNAEYMMQDYVIACHEIGPINVDMPKLRGWVFRQGMSAIENLRHLFNERSLN